MIKDPVQITINNSYNLVDWEKEIIKKCFFDNPESSVEDLAERLGISERTLFRNLRKHGLSPNFKTNKKHVA